MLISINLLFLIVSLVASCYMEVIVEQLQLDTKFVMNRSSFR